jgi:hypothetical protein
MPSATQFHIQCFSDSVRLKPCFSRLWTLSGRVWLETAMPPVFGKEKPPCSDVLCSLLLGEGSQRPAAGSSPSKSKRERR